MASSPGLLVAVMLALWLTTSLWGREPPSGDDTMAHLVRAQFTLDELVPHAQLDGWQSRFGLGYQQFLFYGPGFTWLVVLLHWLSLGLLSVAGAFKVAAIVSFVALPLSVAYLAVSFGLGRQAAGLAAILVLCVSSPFGGIGLEGTFGIGLIPNQLGAVLTCLALGAMLRLVADPGPRRVVMAGVALAAVFVTHAISAVILAVLLAIILLTFLGTEGWQAQPFLASSRFATVWRSPPMALLAVAPRQGQPTPGSLLSTPVAAQARLVRAEAQHLIIEATTGDPPPRPSPSPGRPNGTPE